MGRRRREKGERASNGERVTGVGNARYNLVSVLYRVLQGVGWTYDEHIEDAEREGDGEVDFFRQVQEEQGSKRAQNAKGPLDRR